VQSLGGAIGVIAVCLIQDRYGRKMGFAFGAGFALLGSALAAGATNM
jgi:MFS family permease